MQFFALVHAHVEKGEERSKKYNDGKSMYKKRLKVIRPKRVSVLDQIQNMPPSMGGSGLEGPDGYMTGSAGLGTAV